ncbi:MAG: 16S rRNA (cytidine(1402)-2'-O)-methyltransferase [Candidatus Omnitrophica bacterium]|nr:16S rRNA (cytidine(1402)-2'-O)-methyltransferase [Candidatus Omnitrophota bacterium]MBU1932564.1 16S rRNA (cytidine(1402)-2'-O)-methyltransferase [Candidatus Omnitrophota bacterium]
MSGKLFIVATPIGNLKDITLRAIETLKSVALIACEDTRHTRKLLDHYGVNTPTTSYFEHNKMKKGRYLVRLLKEGRQVALVSDSGTPGISDPGYNIINLAIKDDIPVTIIPGPCAFVSALVVSGLPTDSFVFHGFLSNKKTKRRRQLEALNPEKKTMILYESPHRIAKTLADILDILGDREIVIVRELTKMFEEIVRSNVSGALEHFIKRPPRGEFILLIRGN